MKKLYFLLLLCSGFALAQPVINENPAPLTLCSDTGYATFDLTSSIGGITGGQAGVNVSFHVSLADAQNDIYSIGNTSAYTNVNTPSQMVYVRVEENANPTLYSVAYLNLVVYSNPTASLSAAQTVVCVGNMASFQIDIVGGSLPYTVEYLLNGVPTSVTSAASGTITVNLPNDQVQNFTAQLVSVSSGGGCSAALSQIFEIQVVEPAIAYPVSDLVVHETPNDGIATFDLTQNEIAVTGSAAGVIVSYFTSENEAQNNTGNIDYPTTFTNDTNPQTIWVRLQSAASDCFSVTSFEVVVSDTDVVYIPDTSFKNALLTAGYDTSFDGEIQFSEAAAVTFLSIDNLNIADLTGIKSFTSLQQLYAMDNALTTLDLSGMTALKLAYLAGNELTSINLTGVSNLEDLVLNQNQLTTLTLQDMPNLDRFTAMYNNLTALFLSNLPQLREVNVYGNDLTTLDVSAFPDLQILSASSNQLVSLEMIGASSLKTVDFSSNQVSDVDVSGLSNLETLYFSNNPVQSHSWNGVSNLKYLDFGNTQISVVDLPASPTLLTMYCQNNSITALDVSMYPSLTNLSCQANQLSALDVSTLDNLVYLDCSSNSIQTLDLNANTQLQTVELGGNQMEQLFVKNGVVESFGTTSLSGNNFVYICADEAQVATIQAQVGSGAQVNSYCSFTPGGIYNTITGTVKFDAAGNGCDAADASQPLIKVHMTDGVQGVDVFTNDQAVYNFYVGQDDYTVNPVFENNYFNVSPSVSSIDFPIVDGSVSTNDFCLTANGVNPDAEIVVAPVVPARPGFDAVYRITFRNKGNQTLGQVYGISFFYDENVMDFVSSTQTPVSIGPGALSWNYANLQPFESRSIEVTVNVNAPTDTPAVNIDDVFTFTANINATGDVAAADNTFALEQVVVGSFDPNDKKCLEGEIVSPMMIGDYLHYVINFENTGTAPAENIVIKDVINPAMFDRSSLMIVGSSHPVVAKSGSDGTIFIFQSINLDSGGHGNILLKVKSQTNLHEGDTVSNKADIYFDYNFPIETNTAHTTFQSLSVDTPTDVSIGISPNPAAHSFSVKANSKILSMQLFDVQGRLIQVKMVDENESKFDISDRQTGIYFVKVTTEKGIKVEKIVKL